MLPLVAIVGRPNVGKSTLFNRLISRKEAIVYDQPGVTRDRHYAETEWIDFKYRLVDTGGYEVEPSSTLFEQMRNQVDFAITEADLLIFVVDGQSGPLPEDEEMAQKIRQTGKPVFLAINKVDHFNHESSLNDFYKWGFEDLFGVSAEHGRGISQLLDGVKDFFKDSFEKEEIEEEPEKNIRIAILGRPNVGKSTLFNRLYGAPRSVVHAEPGTTRDPVDVTIEYEGKKYKIIDTAGIRRRAHSDGKVETVSVMKSLRTAEKSDVIFLMIDASIGISSQDGKLADEIVSRGKPVLLLVNKWDLMDEISAEQMEEKVYQKIKEFDFIPVMPISAKSGKGLSRIFRSVEEIYTEYTKRLSTGQVNRVFQKVIDTNPPPTSKGRSISFFYMSQIGTAPPKFAIMTNFPTLVPEFYKRYLIREIRKAFGFVGTPIQLIFKARRKKQFHA